ncbi:MAG: YqaA family protein [Oligoflexus sp.]
MTPETNAETSLANAARAPIHRRLYDWVLNWANSPYAMTALVIIAFAESSFFPIPPDILLMPLVLGAPRKWWKIALVCTIASVLGGIVGYGIGVFAWESMGRWIVEGLLGVNLISVDGRLDIALPAYLVSNFESWLGGTYLFQVYDAWNAWIVGIFGLTPLPYKLVTVTAGVARVDLGIFIIASIASRGMRFFMVALILRLIGEPAKTFIDKNFNLLTILFVVALIGGFAVFKLIL